MLRAALAWRRRLSEVIVLTNPNKTPIVPWSRMVQVDPNYYQQIPGEFDFEAIYDLAIDRAAPGDIFVEVGSWYGKSTAYMASRLAMRQPLVQFFAVDQWLEGRTNNGQQEYRGMFHEFLQNMLRGKLIEFIAPLRTFSHHAAQFFDAESVSFCFIDADHTYEAVKLDLQSWYPRIKKGGLIGGHDYHNVYSGVTQAVEEFFGSPVQQVDSSWLVQKGS